eukprot:comp22349_c0_seq1/m.33259 comp22349_c0_seq1/g.33259  ORF comp22349_c0_seq1/g.33259 comp22349_c0_seq1/m.33259 type:complete len:219 (-) comp22349_c0_seq1:285-941(-)
MAKPRSAMPVAINDVHGDNRWFDMHEHQVELARTKPASVVLVGDSLVQRWADFPSWQQYFGDALNLGIGGDRTEHVLWRLQNGSLEPTQPKVVVIMAGTNNHGDSAEDVAAGISAIADYIRGEKPDAHVIIMALFPRGRKPNPLRGKRDTINALLKARYPPGPSVGDTKVHVLDIGAQYLLADGRISETVMPDYLHLNNEAYVAWAGHLRPLVDTLLQ